MWLSGLEHMIVDDGLHFIAKYHTIEERRQFKRLIMSGKYDDCIHIAKQQVMDGTLVIDFNMDDESHESKIAMEKFVKIAMNEPEVCKVPFVFEATNFHITVAGLKWCQGKPIINGISLKVGEKLFKEQAILLRKHEAAVVLMAFDENGQAAVTEEDKFRICKRCFEILISKKVNFPPEDIIFDPNVLPFHSESQNNSHDIQRKKLRDSASPENL